VGCGAGALKAGYVSFSRVFETMVDMDLCALFRTYRKTSAYLYEAFVLLVSLEYSQGVSEEQLDPIRFWTGTTITTRRTRNSCRWTRSQR
jgi:hypothetical protein